MKRFAPTALMFGNIVTGTSIMAPAGMLQRIVIGSRRQHLQRGIAGDLRRDGAVRRFAADGMADRPDRTPHAAHGHARGVGADQCGFGACARLCQPFGDPPDHAGDRRAVYAAGGGYRRDDRSDRKRGSTIAYIFLGWSLAAAVGLPLVTFVASRYGWRTAYGGIGALGFLSFVLLAWRLPGGLLGAPVDLKTWTDVGRNRTIGLLLLVTTLQMSGQFVVFTFMGPLLKRLTQAGPDAIGLVFALYGVFGFVGIAIATRIVNSWGAYKTSLLFTSLLLAGVSGWAISAGIYPLMAASVAVWDAVLLPPIRCSRLGWLRRRGAGLGLGRAQYVGALCRAGHWFCYRRCVICARSAIWRRLRVDGPRRAGAADGDADEIAAWTNTKWGYMRTLFALVALLYSTAVMAQSSPPPAASSPPTVGGQPLVQVKPHSAKAAPAPKESGQPKSIAKKTAGLPRDRRRHQGPAGLLRCGFPAQAEPESEARRPRDGLPLHQGRGRAAELLQRICGENSEVLTSMAFSSEACPRT